MNFLSDYIPSNEHVDESLYLLDPFSVIIKLAILSKKPIGTKLYIQRNILHFQEPGPFQGFCRKVINRVNRSEIHYLNNPLQLACQHFLTPDFVRKYPALLELFH